MQALYCALLDEKRFSFYPIYKGGDADEPAIILWEHEEIEETLQDLLRKKKVVPSLDGAKSATRRIERMSLALMCAHAFRSPVEIGHDADGRPFLKGRTEEISISHSRDVYALSVGRHRHGVDVERWSERALRLRSRFVTDEEWQLAERLFPEDSKQFLATMLWSAKEAAFKAIGMRGITVTDDICFVGNDAEGRQLFYIKGTDKQVRVETKSFAGFVLTIGEPVPQPTDTK